MFYNGVGGEWKDDLDDGHDLIIRGDYLAHESWVLNLCLVNSGRKLWLPLSFESHSASSIPPTLSLTPQIEIMMKLTGWDIYFLRFFLPKAFPTEIHHEILKDTSPHTFDNPFGRGSFNIDITPIFHNIERSTYTLDMAINRELNLELPHFTSLRLGINLIIVAKRFTLTRPQPDNRPVKSAISIAWVRVQTSLQFDNAECVYILIGTSVCGSSAETCCLIISWLRFHRQNS